MARGAGDGHGRAHALGIGRRPLQRLHAAHRAADDAQQFLDAQRVEQHRLGPHHVADGDQRKVEAIGLAGRGIDFGRAGRAHAAADDIGADDEEAVGIDGLARSHHGRPPARLAGDGMVAGDELVAGQGMADQDGVALGRIERAIGHIGDGEGRQACGRNPAPAACRRRRSRPGRHRRPGAVNGTQELRALSVMAVSILRKRVAKAGPPPCQRMAGLCALLLGRPATINTGPFWTALAALSTPLGP